jgi:hypothetical protein
MTETTEPLPEVLWTVADVARFFRCSTSIVYKRVARGDLPCVRFGALVRFDPLMIRALARGEPATETQTQLVRLERR